MGDGVFRESTINQADHRTRGEGLKPLTGEFDDAALEARYWLDRAGEHARWGSVAGVLAFCLCLVLTVTDLAGMGFGPRYAAVVFLRLLSGVPAIGLALTLRRSPQLIRRHDVVSAVSACVLLGSATAALIQPDPAGLANMEIGLLIVALFVLVPNRIEHTAILTTGTAVVFVTITAVSRHLSSSQALATAGAFVGAVVMGFVSANVIGATRRREYAASQAAKHVNARLRAEISQRERVEVELVQRANTDPLTKVGNRRHFEEQAQAEFRRSQRSHEPLSLMIIDVDHFKWINDTHGHPAGDDVLRQLSSLLDEHVRRVDSVGRLGGEEFAVLMPGADRARAEEAAERLRAHVATLALELPTGVVRLTVSIGVTECDVWTEELADGLARADEALYRAKDEGRDRVVMG